jgi:hypothetical protein
LDYKAIEIKALCMPEINDLRQSGKFHYDSDGHFAVPRWGKLCYPKGHPLNTRLMAERYAFALFYGAMDPGLLSHEEYRTYIRRQELIGSRKSQKELESRFKRRAMLE